MLVGLILGVIVGDLVAFFTMALFYGQERDEIHDREQTEWLEEMEKKSDESNEDIERTI